MPWKESLAVTDRVVKLLLCVRTSHIAFLCFIDDIVKPREFLNLARVQRKPLALETSHTPPSYHATDTAENQAAGDCR